MNISKLSILNITHRPLSSALSLILLTLGVSIIALLLQINHHVREQMENNVKGVDMVVGAKGSPLQLILSAIYHIDAPTGNIPLDEVEKLRKNRFATVNTIIRTSTVDIPVDYKLFRKDDGWFAYDVVIEQVSLVRNYRGSFQTIVHDVGIDGLIQQLETKVARSSLPEEDQ